MDISASLLWEIFKHVKSWLINLDRASKERKEQSVKALREVVTASRETYVYMRQMKDTGTREHATERHLSMLWTELGFALDDLGIKKLAEKCQIKGKHWSNPEYYDKEFLKKADLSLEQMEQIANKILDQINSK